MKKIIVNIDSNLDLKLKIDEYIGDLTNLTLDDAISKVFHQSKHASIPNLILLYARSEYRLGKFVRHQRISCHNCLFFEYVRVPYGSGGCKGFSCISEIEYKGRHHEFRIVEIGRFSPNLFLSSLFKTSGSLFRVEVIQDEKKG